MKYFNTTFNVTSKRFDTEFRSVVKVVVGADEIEHYKGDYEIVPKLESQEMETKNKLMDKNITVEGIPITRVSNTSGGNTIIIGG